MSSATCQIKFAFSRKLFGVMERVPGSDVDYGIIVWIGEAKESCNLSIMHGKKKDLRKVKEKKMTETTQVAFETAQILPQLPKQLVDRKEQSEKIIDVIELISHRDAASSKLFEWYGTPGIGKSMLLEMSLTW